ncbi:AI-2E family transporter [Deinococcus detaillensis]|uniref:AI-2E family transporter n=1 Tax=Deinococcus detaillensis TaxID=2592048 RepID=A0A553UWP1_9DEIO|nr:AI-2E family transporter [Deinococcus detaillensis]TSA84616.1 AI-2E family transporter [Deinococcus detaillensis]
MTPTRSIPGLLSVLWRLPWLRLLVYLALVALVVVLARLLASVVVTALIAYALAFVVHPVLAWLEKRRVKRTLGVLLVVVFLLSVVSLLSWTVLSQVVSLIGELPALAARLPDLIGGLLKRLSSVPGLESAQKQFSVFLTQEAQQLRNNLGPTFQRLLTSGGTVLGGVVSVVGWLGQGVLVLILSVYFMLDYERVGHGFLRILPLAWQPTALQLSEDVALAFGGYLRGQLLIGLAVGALVALGLILLGIPNALAIGLLAAVLDIVPYLGPVVSALPAVLLALPSGWVTVLLVVGVFIVANQIEGNLLSPFIMGKTTNLSPAAVLLAILAGLTLGGLVGAVLAIPTVTLLWRWTLRYWLPSAAYNSPPKA